MFREVCPYPVIHDEAIAGNPDHTDPDELRSADAVAVFRY
jgi:hypothetical protein